jgi:hypothetical protein
VILRTIHQNKINDIFLKSLEPDLLCEALQIFLKISLKNLEPNFGIFQLL